MEITTRKVLTNAELLEIMEKKKKEGLDEFKKSLFSEENSKKSDKLYSYLKDNCELSLEKIAQLSQDLKRFELDKLEKLQILNLLPVTEAELLLMIREGNTRFTSDELNTICALVVQAKNK